MLTDRDQSVVDFVADFKVARTSVIRQLFYPSDRVAARRLTELVNLKELKRERDSQYHEYIYYITRPKHLKHAAILTDTYALYKRNALVKTFAIEPAVGDIRPDAIIVYEDRGKEHIAFIEVELSNKGLDIAKYEQFFQTGAYKDYFSLMPELVIVTDKKVPNTDLDIIVMPTKLKKPDN